MVSSLLDETKLKEPLKLWYRLPANHSKWVVTESAPFFRPVVYMQKQI